MSSFSTNSRNSYLPMSHCSSYSSDSHEILQTNSMNSPKTPPRQFVSNISDWVPPTPRYAPVDEPDNFPIKTQDDYTLMDRSKSMSSDTSSLSSTFKHSHNESLSTKFHSPARKAFSHSDISTPKDNGSRTKNHTRDVVAPSQNPPSSVLFPLTPEQTPIRRNRKNNKSAQQSTLLNPTPFSSIVGKNPISTVPQTFNVSCPSVTESSASLLRRSGHRHQNSLSSEPNSIKKSPQIISADKKLHETPRSRRTLFSDLNPQITKASNTSIITERAEHRNIQKSPPSRSKIINSKVHPSSPIKRSKVLGTRNITESIDNLVVSQDNDSKIINKVNSFSPTKRNIPLNFEKTVLSSPNKRKIELQTQKISNSLNSDDFKPAHITHNPLGKRRRDEYEEASNDDDEIIIPDDPITYEELENDEAISPELLKEIKEEDDDYRKNHPHHQSDISNIDGMWCVFRGKKVYRPFPQGDTTWPKFKPRVLFPKTDSKSLEESTKPISSSLNRNRDDGLNFPKVSPSSSGFNYEKANKNQNKSTQIYSEAIPPSIRKQNHKPSTPSSTLSHSSSSIASPQQSKGSSVFISRIPRSVKKRRTSQDIFPSLSSSSLFSPRRIISKTKEEIDSEDEDTDHEEDAPSVIISTPRKREQQPNFHSDISSSFPSSSTPSSFKVFPSLSSPSVSNSVSSPSTSNQESLASFRLPHRLNESNRLGSNSPASSSSTSSGGHLSSSRKVSDNPSKKQYFFR